MNRKNLILTFLLAIVLISLAGVRLTSDASASSTGLSNADDAAELVLTFEVRIRLPFAEKELL